MLDRRRMLKFDNLPVQYERRFSMKTANNIFQKNFNSFIKYVRPMTHIKQQISFGSVLGLGYNKFQYYIHGSDLFILTVTWFAPPLSLPRKLCENDNRHIVHYSVKLICSSYEVQKHLAWHWTSLQVMTQ